MCIIITVYADTAIIRYCIGWIGTSSFRAFLIEMIITAKIKMLYDERTVIYTSYTYVYKRSVTKTVYITLHPQNCTYMEQIMAREPRK